MSVGDYKSKVCFCFAISELCGKAIETNLKSTVLYYHPVGLIINYSRAGLIHFNPGKPNERVKYKSEIKLRVKYDPRDVPGLRERTRLQKQYQVNESNIIFVNKMRLLNALCKDKEVQLVMNPSTWCTTASWSTGARSSMRAESGWWQVCVWHCI